MRQLKVWTSVIAVLALAGTLALAEGQMEEPSADRLPVVATTNIVGDIVARVGGERVSLYVMLPHGADPHAFQATPRDARQAADAAVVFINGAGLEADFLGDLIASAEPRFVVDLSAHLELRSMVDMHDDEDAHDDHEHEHDEEEAEHDEGEEHDDEDGHDEDEEGHEHEDEEEHDEHEHDEDEEEHEEGEEHEDEDEHEHEEEHDEHDDEEGAHGHDHGEFDPHVWMDPTLVAAWTEEIAEALAEVDPDHATGYAERADALAGELQALDAWVRDRVDAIPRDRRILVTDHDVFGYFADRYGFTVLDSIIPGFSTVSEPSARHLAGLREAIADHGVPAIFVGLTVSSQAAQVVADDLGIEVVSVYTGSLSEPDGPAATYQDFIRTNVDRIVAALAGS